MSVNDYEVGYKKPPRAWRWVPGQSGNLKGRRPKNVELSPIAQNIEQGLMRKVALPGSRNRITIFELILKQILKQMHGKQRKKALRVWRKYERYAKSKPAIRLVARKSREEREKEKQEAVQKYAEYLRQQDEACIEK